MANKRKQGYLLACCFLAIPHSLFAASETVVTAGLTYKYDDNVFKQDLDNIESSDSTRSGAVFTKSAGVSTNLNWSKIGLVGAVGVNQADYFSQSELNNQSYDLNLKLFHSVNEKVELNAVYVRSRKVKDFAETDIRQKNEVELSSLNFGFSYKVNERLKFVSQMTELTSRNLLNELSALDSRKTVLSLSSAMQIASKLGSELRYTASESEPLNGNNESLNYNQAVIGISFDYSHSPKTNLAADLSQQEFLGNKSLNYSMNIDYRATPKSQFNLSFFNQQVDSVNETSVQSKNTGVAFGYNYLYSAKWSYLLNTQVVEQEADAILSGVVEPYSDNLKSVSLTANYLFNKVLSFSLGYTHQERTSSREGFDYISNVFQINSNLQF